MKKSCEELRKNNPDVKDQMATLLIQHNLLEQKDWEQFHKEIQKIVKKQQSNWVFVKH